MQQIWRSSTRYVCLEFSDDWSSSSRALNRLIKLVSASWSHCNLNVLWLIEVLVSFRPSALKLSLTESKCNPTVGVFVCCDSLDGSARVCWHKSDQPSHTDVLRKSRCEGLLSRCNKSWCGCICVIKAHTFVVQWEFTVCLFFLSFHVAFKSACPFSLDKALVKIVASQLKNFRTAIELSLTIAEDGCTLATDALFTCQQITEFFMSSTESQNDHRHQTTLRHVQAQINNMFELAEAAQARSIKAINLFRNIRQQLWPVNLWSSLQPQF